MTGTYYGVEVAYMAALFFAFDYFAEEGSRHSDPPATKLAVFLVLAVTYPIVFAIRRRCLSRPPGSAFSRSFDFLASALTGLFAGVIAVILISTGSNTDEHTDEHFSPTTNRVIFAVVGLITTAVSFTRKIE